MDNKLRREILTINNKLDTIQIEICELLWHKNGVKSTVGLIENALSEFRKITEPPVEPIQSFWDEKQSAMAKRIADSILPAVKDLKTISQEERRKLIKRVDEIVKMNYPESHKERR